MSCNGCRVLKQRCEEPCMLKQSLQWIHDQSQGHATLFAVKYYGRTSLMSRISAMSDHKRPLLFMSLLFEAVGRTINPGGGAVELLWTGNWHLCQYAVEAVLRGGTLEELPRADGRILAGTRGNSSESIAECNGSHPSDQPYRTVNQTAISRSIQNQLEGDDYCTERGLDLNFVTTMIERIAATGRVGGRYLRFQTPGARKSSGNSDEK